MKVKKSKSKTKTELKSLTKPKIIKIEKKTKLKKGFSLFLCACFDLFIKIIKK